MYFRNLLLILVVLTASHQLSSAQSRFGRFLQERMELGVQAGTSGYIGEIDNTGYGFNSFTTGASAKYFFKPIASTDRTWGIRADYNFIQLKGDDAQSSNLNQQARNLNFSNTIHEASAMAEFQFFEFRPNRVKNMITPYVFLGMGMIWHNPKGTLNGEKYSLIDQRVEVRDVTLGNDSIGTSQPTNVKTHRKAVLTIPMGAGVKYNLTGRLAPWSIGLEVNYRYAFSGFLDGVNDKYMAYDQVFVPGATGPMNGNQADWESLAGGQNSSYTDLIGTQRGNNKNDWYMTGVFKVTYTFYRWRDPLWK